MTRGISEEKFRKLFDKGVLSTLIPSRRIGKTIANEVYLEYMTNKIREKGWLIIYDKVEL
ncbi:hypothetical protein DRO61_11940 [Candidatus Bathyarchaeota archaeon]|nr:MAG: hypothetical protein DRO61_11940 [Candidatus Bathyarchaeota archaeon]